MQGSMIRAFFIYKKKHFLSTFVIFFSTWKKSKKIVFVLSFFLSFFLLLFYFLYVLFFFLVGGIKISFYCRQRDFQHTNWEFFLMCWHEFPLVCNVSHTLPTTTNHRLTRHFSRGLKLLSFAMHWFSLPFCESIYMFLTYIFLHTCSIEFLCIFSYTLNSAYSIFNNLPEAVVRDTC